MYTKRNVGWGLIFRYAWQKVIFYTFDSGVIFCVYLFLGWDFIDAPVQPLTVIGIAVAFYIGFKKDLIEVGPQMREWYLFLMIPFSVLISWIFSSMDSIGDNSEDPFEGRINDVPMTALCRTIEIDLRDMLDEENLPESIKPKDHILY